MQSAPLVVLDGAKDVEAAKAIMNAIEIFNYNKLFTVVSISSDKKLYEMMKVFAEKTDYFVVTAHNVMGRAAKTIQLSNIAEKLGKASIEKHNVNEALKYVFKTANETDMILIIGSVFLVGEARKLLKPSS